MCIVKNVVYEIVCKVCHHKYIGETHRTFRTRIREHIRPNTNSNVYRHFVESHHNTTPSLDCIDYRIRRGGFRDTLQRKMFEFSLIRNEHPEMNVQIN